MYLNPQDIQIGSGEPMQDTAIVISSMVDGILARLGGHEEIETLAKHSSVPVINALTAKFHPLQVDFSFPLGGSDSIATVPYSTDPRRPPHFI